MSIPETGNICTSNNYIKIASTEELYVTLNIGEEDITKVLIGQEANITITANSKQYIGTIDKISDVGTYNSSGSTFLAKVKFANDGTVKLGMSANCTVILEKAENVIAVPKEAVQTANGAEYVIIVNNDGTTENKVVETGISNDAYTEIKIGLEGIERVEYTVETNSSNGGRQFTQNGNGGMPVRVQGGAPMGF